MNVIFHTASAVGIAVMLTDTKAIERSTTNNKVLVTAFLCFAVCIISHGVLDYIPHCYPINSKVDAIAGLTIILSTIWLTNKKYRFIVGLSFLGSILPDIVDLAPAIINKQVGLRLPILDKVFPWHLPSYSGSIYSDNCKNSTLNHLFLMLTCVIICWGRRADLKRMFKKV